MIEEITGLSHTSIPEHLRNNYLRRVDWRFLLPHPNPQKTACFAQGELAKGVELISSSTLHPDAHPEDCDLAVAVNPRSDTLRSAWRSLKPGGCCYTEWYGVRSAGAARVRHRLQLAGFEAAACYWVWPWPALSKPRFWVDLEADGGLRHFLFSRPRPRTRIRRAGTFILRLGWRLAVRHGLALSICVVARKPISEHTAFGKPSAAVTPTVKPAVLATIRDRWPQWGLGPSPARLSWSLMTGGIRSVNKIVGLVFAEPDPRPVLAVKMPRVPESAAPLRKEAAVLQAVQALHGAGLAGVPQALFCNKIEGVPTLIETAFTGIPILYLLRRNNYRSYAITTMDWLSALAEHPVRSPRSEWWDRLVVPVLRDFTDHFGSVVDRGMLREAEDVVSSLDDVSMVCEQRDFSPWNVLVDGDGKLAVLDWESAETKGLSGLDAVYFLAFASFFLDDAMKSREFSKSYRNMLDRTTFTGGVASECMQYYAERTAMSQAAFRPLRVLAWMLHSRSEYQRFVADDAGRRPDRERLRSSMFVKLLEDEVRYGR